MPSTENELGKIVGFKHEIQLNTGIPFWAHPYPIPLKQKYTMMNHIKELVNKYIIVKSESPYSSPVFLKSKPNGQHRLIGYFRKLNSLTITEHYPYPDVHCIFNELKGRKIISQTDLDMGFHQVKMDPIGS